MSNSVVYRAEFVSKDNILWRCDILRTNNGEILPLIEVNVPLNPLTLEWSECSRDGVLQSSAATLIIESASDRQFIDLYSVEVGEISLHVYRANKLYWIGTLDTELYEEPYAYNDHYDVTLTFSDFAPLSRMNWSLRGFITIEDVVNESLNKAYLNGLYLDSRISTKIANAYKVPISLRELRVNCDNFYDEQGEPMNIEEVLIGCLQPLALRIVQHNGSVMIYDINALCGLDAKEVSWSYTDSMLSTDKVYSAVRVGFSPYADTVLLDTSLETDEVAQESPIVHSQPIEHNGSDVEGFTIYLGGDGPGNLTIGGGAKFYRIVPGYSGNEEAGVAITAEPHIGSVKEPLAGLTKDRSIFSPLLGLESEVIIKTPSVYVPRVNYGANNYSLKITLDTLYDVRSNPFEAAHQKNDEGAYKRLVNQVNFAYVPVIITLRDANGTALFHYNNYNVYASNGYWDKGEWISGEGKLGDCFLAYYDSSDRKSASGFGGWKTNRPIIGYYREDLPRNIITKGDGEFIPLPPTDGYIEIQIGSRPHHFDFGRTIAFNANELCWVMHKDIKVEVVKENGLALEAEDVEYSASINSAAKEELEISTICGSYLDTLPTARGLYYNLSGEPLRTLCRANVEAPVEKLLIGTLYSQFSRRSTILSGEVELTDHFGVYSDASSAGKFMMQSQVQDPYEGTSQISLVEIHEDNYTGIDYE